MTAMGMIPTAGLEKICTVKVMAMKVRETPAIAAIIAARGTRLRICPTRNTQGSSRTPSIKQHARPVRYASSASPVFSNTGAIMSIVKAKKRTVLIPCGKAVNSSPAARLDLTSAQAPKSKLLRHTVSVAPGTILLMTIFCSTPTRMRIELKRLSKRMRVFKNWANPASRLPYVKTLPRLSRIRENWPPEGVYAPHQEFFRIRS
mmetsp:Transcript_5026/g.10455  ORF Transcript_5026/g.10455 Transcript_5026/m.10455 type:complete len:204 (-) Transcript_5026:2092-2703(-)